MKSANNNVRYGVVGLGQIAQVAVLPAFTQAKRNSTLVSIVTDRKPRLVKAVSATEE